MGVDSTVEEGATESCIIYLGDFSSGEELCRLPCLHLYDAKRIDERLNTGTHHWCPLCKTNVFSPAAPTPPAAGTTSNGIGTASNSTRTTPPVIINSIADSSHDAV
eukprot:g12338.t1